MADEALEEKIARVVREHVAVVPYDPRWPRMFEAERNADLKSPSAPGAPAGPAMVCFRCRQPTDAASEVPMRAPERPC